MEFLVGGVTIFNGIWYVNAERPIFSNRVQLTSGEDKHLHDNL